MKEWKSYSMNNGGDGRDSENDIKMLALLLASSFKPTEICTRKCLGVFKDPLNERYGIIYQPPTYIEDFWTVNTQDSAVARFCKPVTLLGLIEKSADPRRSASILDLGIRFQLAKQLAQSVLILHAAGWVHKKYDHPLSWREHEAWLTIWLLSQHSIDFRYVPSSSIRDGWPLKKLPLGLRQPMALWFWPVKTGRSRRS